MPLTAQLLTTKLYLPPVRPNRVPRPRLIDRLNTLRPLTLIAAPAGFGKTTVVSEWHAEMGQAIAWLSLDDDDNDPTRFLSLVVAALQTLKTEVGETALALLQSSQPPPPKAILTTLLNDLDSIDSPIVLALDDYHVITAQPIHAVLTYLLDHLPSQMRLVITSRADPPFPLARLRARDQLTELRADDLRFTLDEAVLFLNNSMGLRLSREDITALEARTEGWIAGLQLAALSLQGRADASGFIKAFSGSHRHVLSYLVEEVLNHRPAGTLNFLLQTSVLDRLCGSLCDAVTGQVDGRATLEKLELANLFLVPLDDVGQWYRYHQLFAEVLRHRLQQSQPQAIVELHRRAAGWYEQHDLHSEAVSHALSTSDYALVARLVERAAWTLLGRGEVITLQRWLDSLPASEVRARPRLNLAYGMILSITNQAEALERRLRAVETAPQVDDPGFVALAPAERDSLLGQVAALEAHVALAHYDHARGIELCQKALALTPPDNVLMRSVVSYFLGNAQRMSGDIASAIQTFVECSRLGLSAGNPLLVFNAQCNTASLQQVQGHLQAAATTYQQALHMAVERSWRQLPVTGLAHIGLGTLLYEWNDLEGASHHLREGINLCQQGGLTTTEAFGGLILAQAHQARGDARLMQLALQQAGQMARDEKHQITQNRVAAFGARMALRQGHLDLASQWAATSGLHADDADVPYSRESEYLTLVRVLIAQHAPEPATAIVNRFLPIAEAGGLRGSAIEILVLSALALQALAHSTQALAALDRALMLAEPEGFVRIFVDEGEPMRLLLSDLRLKTRNRALRIYADKLLAAFGQIAVQPDPAGHQKSIVAHLAEPLSDREREVLLLMADGLSNAEIAGKLIISTGTVKTHVHNILGKLGATTRVQAVARARALSLLTD